MIENLIFTRNKFNSILYQKALKRLFFKLDPEDVHDRIIKIGKLLGKSKITKKISSLNFYYSNSALEQKILGIKFKNPIGLAAGFDKNAELTDILPSIGFGFAEVGSITGEACYGNPKPRLWRLKKSKGLIVNYGLKNDGAVEIAKRLKVKNFAIPIGTSIAKTNSKNTVEVDAGIKDYVKAFKEFTSIGNYFTINISCPNAFGGQPFTESKRLDKLLIELDKIQTKKPIFLKISPDLSQKETYNILEVVKNHRIHGFICSNLTKYKHSHIGGDIASHIGKITGGISGKIVEEKANQLIEYIFKKTKGKYIIIGCGGVFSAKDAYKKIKLGASLVQLITGMIFQGPQIVSEINQGLVKLLKQDGFSNIKKAIGKDVIE